MRNSNKLTFNRIFFVGIGGISMSALAKLSVSNGYIVAGSDSNNNEMVQNLRENKIKVHVGHSLRYIKNFKPDLVVYTGAIKEDNVELKYAKSNNIPCMERADFLGEICKKYCNVIAIGGTHGKTTTSAMIAEIFDLAGLNPTAHIGGVVKNFNSNLKLGDNKYFITEACEYKKSFEKIYSDCAVITNIEKDHMDCYDNMEDLVKSFKTFAEHASSVVVTTCDFMEEIINKKLTICLCGNSENCTYFAKNLTSVNGNYEFDCYENNKFLMHFKLNVMGIYNVTNSLFAICVARTYGINLNYIYNGLLNFNGVKRRNEYLGTINGVKVFADYCHHPTEIRNSISGYKEIYKKILCIFQPHTYSRTIALKDDFVTCFVGVKKLIIFKTYPAREVYNEKGSETALYKIVKNRNKALLINYDTLDEEIKKCAKNYDVILVLGAGDLYEHFTNLNQN